MEEWHIVKFIEENDMVEAVPASWIFGESADYKCLWPDTISGAKVKAAIRAKETPAENWKSIPVEILSSSPYDNFYVATKKAGMAKYTSELDTESEFSRENILKKRKKKKNSRYFSSEDDTSSPEKVVRRSPRFKLPTPPGNNSQLASRPQSEILEVVKRNLNLEKEVTTELIIPNTNSDPSNLRTAFFTAAKQKCLFCKDSTEIIRLLHIINGRVTQNAELITAILNSRNENNIQDNNKTGVDLIDIPAKSYVELMELDKKLSDKNIRQFMVTKLLHVGGIDIKDVIRRCMPQLVDDDILRQFSWVGGKGKKKFSTLDMATLIKEVCQKTKFTKQFTEKQVEERLAIFLTKATERCNRRLNKENKHNDPDEELVQ